MKWWAGQLSYFFFFSLLESLRCFWLIMHTSGKLCMREIILILQDKDWIEGHYWMRSGSTEEITSRSILMLLHWNPEWKALLNFVRTKQFSWHLIANFCIHIQFMNIIECTHIFHSILKTGLVSSLQVRTWRWVTLQRAVRGSGLSSIPYSDFFHWHTKRGKQ